MIKIYMGKIKAYTDNDNTPDIYLNWYDFEARSFDPQIGRWHVPDPVAQYPSPYIGMGNNPVRLIDPDGLAAVWSWEAEHWYRPLIPDGDGTSGHFGPFCYRPTPRNPLESDDNMFAKRAANSIECPYGEMEHRREVEARFYAAQEEERLKNAKAEIEKALSDPAAPKPETNELDAACEENASSQGVYGAAGPSLEDLYSKTKVGTITGSNVEDITNTSLYPGVTIIQGEPFTDITGKGFYLNGVIHVPEGYGNAGIQHEYGHYLHESYFPDEYDGVPEASFINSIFCPNTHKFYWTEIIANKLAVMFFGPKSEIAKMSEIFPTHR